MFTDKELKVAKMKLEGLMNKEIAKRLDVSGPDISQTLARVRKKVRTVQDSTELLMKMGLIQESPRYVMTEKGRKLARVSEKKLDLNLGLHEIFSIGAIIRDSTASIFKPKSFTDCFIVKHTGETSEAFNWVPIGSFHEGVKKTIISKGDSSETRIGILDKKTIVPSSTLEPTPCVAVP